MKISKWTFLLIAGLALVVFADRAWSEFYRYVDRSGNVHYVDNAGKIPGEYLESQKTYTEPDDFLSPDEKNALKERERALEQDHAREIEAQISSRSQTDVSIQGNRVLVPVELGSEGRTVSIHLILDTGADMVVVDQSVARRLGLKPIAKGKARVATGAEVDAQLAELSYIEVGPHRKTHMRVLIIEQLDAGATHSGLLGMNFLRNLDYFVDFQNQVIRWKP